MDRVQAERASAPMPRSPLRCMLGGRAKKLTQRHTLANSPGYREAVTSGAMEPVEMADTVVTSVLGMSDRQPALDVFRTELRDGDAILVGNLALSDAIAQRACEWDG